LSANAEILWILVEHLLLTGLPAVAAALLTVRRGARNVPLILAISLAASGLVALLSFWAYYADPEVGKAWSFLVLFGSAEAVVWTLWRGNLDRAVLARLRTPPLLWVAAGFFVVYLGFLHGGTELPLHAANSRFSGQLPSDNDIPQFFSSWFYENGHEGRPPLFPGEWLSSDRPPLQIGYVLSQRPFGWDEALMHYQVLCVLVQQLWVVGMWAVLCAAGLSRRARALAIIAAMVSDIALLHGFFVWPKLIAATFLLGALALVLSPEWERWRRDPRVGALFAALCGLALLSHGSSAFALVAVFALGALRGLPSWRWLGVAALAGIVLMAPWSAYQRYEDPPGNRLLKWQLGGVMEIDQRGVGEAIVDSYEEAGFDGVVDAKWDNFEEMLGVAHAPDELDNAADRLGDGEIETAMGHVRGVRFFSLVPLLGILLIAPIAMLLVRDRGRRQLAEWRFAIFCFAFVVVGCLAWGLLMFGSPNAVAYLHVGSLTLPLLGICGCVAGLYAVSWRLAAAVVGLNMALVLALYVPSLEPLPGTEYSPLAGFLAAAALVGFAAVAWRAGASDSSRSQGTRSPKGGGEVGTSTSAAPSAAHS
jgi:hypothetical protein